MKNLINMRFGPGVWEGIIAERAKRIQEQKEAERQERIEKRRKHKELIHTVEVGGLVIAGCVGAIAVLVALVILL
jgi:hypothetical protein